jgi:hypothetical protein
MAFLDVSKDTHLHEAPAQTSRQISCFPTRKDDGRFPTL